VELVDPDPIKDTSRQRRRGNGTERRREELKREILAFREK